MRLEVIADNRGAVIYVLNRPEIYIGSTENNDIVIPAQEVSKKHLKLIITEDEKCFVIDQGSTNGTFLNDERIIPGRREEFRINTSLRLGDQVLLTLLGKDKGDVPELPLREQFVEEKKITIADEDKTRVISLKTLQKTKTEKVRKKRLKKLEKEKKKKNQVRKDKATINRALMSAMVVFGIGYGAMKLWNVTRERKARRTVVAQMKETQLLIDDTIESIEEGVTDNLIEQSVLLSMDDITKHASDVSCALPEENFFCKRMPLAGNKNNGAVNINNQIVIYLDQKEWLAKARELTEFYRELNKKEVKPVEAARPAVDEDESAVVEPETKDDREVSDEMLQRIAYFAFMKQYLSRSIPEEMQVYNLYIAFYSTPGMQLESVMAIKVRNIPKVTIRYAEDFFRFKKYDPYKIMQRLDRFYKIYK